MGLSRGRRSLGRFAALILAMFAEAAIAGTLVPINVRIEGLALGNALSLRQGSTTITATLNEAIVLGQAEMGSALSIQVLTQPAGQVCALSAQVPSVVSSAPVFVRCVHTAAPRITMPTTSPNEPLGWWQSGASLRTIAYPGLAYESRLSAVGGTFPYEFRLLAARLNGLPMPLSAFSIDFRRGTLRFVPQAGNFEFDIEVRDSGAVQKVAQRTFAVAAAVNAFLFVAPNGVDAPGRGSITQPLQSIPYALAQGTSAQALMLRAGVYSGFFALQDGRVKQIFAYPDEVPVLALNRTGAINVRVSQAPVARIEGVDVSGVSQYGLISDPSPAGVVIRLVRFLDGVVVQAGENPAYLHGFGDNSALSRHRFLVQDSEFNNFPNGFAVTWFDAGDSVFENNQVRLGASTDGIHDKDNSQRNVHRENYIEYAPQFANNDGVRISAQDNSRNMNIHHNLFINSGVTIGGQCFQDPGCTMRAHDVHHNTIVGGSVVLRWGVFNSSSSDTRVSNNLIRSTPAPYAWAACLGTVPSAFATLLRSRFNRFETASANAIRDTECPNSPINMNWATWVSTHGQDTVGSGSVLSATSDLVGTGALTRLPPGDPRLKSFGHRYPLPVNDATTLFANGFE